MKSVSHANTCLEAKVFVVKVCSHRVEAPPLVELGAFCHSSFWAVAGVAR